MKVEYSEVISPADVVGVLVSENHGINPSYLIPETLVTKVGRCVNKNIGSRRETD
jgi:hypothetical protein